MPRPTAVVVGAVYGRWRVLAQVGFDRGRNRRWRCRCEACGRIVTTLAQYLRPVATRRGCGDCRERARWGSLPADE